MHASSKSTKSYIPSIPMGCPRNDVRTAIIGDLMQIAIIDKHSQYQTSTDEQETSYMPETRPRLTAHR